MGVVLLSERARRPGALGRALGLSWVPVLAGPLCDCGRVTFPAGLALLLSLTLWDSEEWALWLAGGESGGSLALSLPAQFAHHHPTSHPELQEPPVILILEKGRKPQV